MNSILSETEILKISADEDDVIFVLFNTFTSQFVLQTIPKRHFNIHREKSQLIIITVLKELRKNLKIISYSVL